jgi:protein TonB
MSIIRIPLAVASGVLVSFAVFLGLWRLVGADLDVGPRIEAKVIDYTRLLEDTPVVTKRRDKPVREPPTVVPPARIEGPGGTVIEEGVILEPTTTRIERGTGLSISGNDRDTQPIIRVPPQYPPGAAERGIQGWVQVRFSVTPTGIVRDAVIVASEPGAVFDQAALAAVARWRYNPRVESGLAVERVGLETLLRFALDE